MAENEGASGFFGSPDDAAGLEKYIQDSEGAFEERAIRQVLKRFGIDAKQWDVKEKFGQRFRFPIFDSVYPNFPVRLGTRRLVSKKLQAAKRRIADFGFHEVRANLLFRPHEFCKTQVFKEWENLKEDQSVDGRCVGLVFQCVSTTFIIHDWDGPPHVAGISLVWKRGDQPSVQVEMFDTFLERVVESFWSP